MLDFQHKKTTDIKFGLTVRFLWDIYNTNLIQAQISDKNKKRTSRLVTNLNKISRFCIQNLRVFN